MADNMIARHLVNKNDFIEKTNVILQERKKDLKSELAKSKDEKRDARIKKLKMIIANLEQTIQRETLLLETQHRSYGL